MQTENSITNLDIQALKQERARAYARMEFGKYYFDERIQNERLADQCNAGSRNRKNGDEETVR